MFDHKNIKPSGNQESIAISLIGMLSSGVILCIIMTVTMRSDIATTAKWYSMYFISTVPDAGVAGAILGWFGNPAYPVEGTALGLSLTLGSIVLMLNYARSGSWFPGRDITWMSAVWGVAGAKYSIDDLNTEKVTSFLMVVVVLFADLGTDVIGRVIVPAGESAFVYYILATPAVFGMNTLLSEILFLGAGVVFVGSLSNLYSSFISGNLKMPSLGRKKKGTRRPSNPRKERGQNPMPTNHVADRPPSSRMNTRPPRADSPTMIDLDSMLSGGD